MSCGLKAELADVKMKMNEAGRWSGNRSHRSTPLILIGSPLISNVIERQINSSSPQKKSASQVLQVPCPLSTNH